MHLRDVLFLVGPKHLASVQLRAIDIARRLGISVCCTPVTVQDIPVNYKFFICVKAIVDGVFLKSLSERGRIIWDVIDDMPPREYIDIYLVSSRRAQAIVGKFGRTLLIRHHHANNDGERRIEGGHIIGWIGHGNWRPVLSGIQCSFYDSTLLSKVELGNLYPTLKVALNIRRRRPEARLHVELNSGIKLINSIGFGIPSVSDYEPAYEEIGDGCTIFASCIADYCRALDRLNADAELYEGMARACARAAACYHIDSISKLYERLLDTA